VHQSLPAGFSASVFNLVQGRGVQVGRAITSHPGISTIAFVGRTETGREIQAAGSEFLKRVQLSLSGSNAVLVFAETDLEKTAAAVVRLCLTSETSAAFRGARVFIQESIYQEFLELLKVQAGAVKAAMPRQVGSRLGPLISAEARDVFCSRVAQATSEKGKILFGGTERPEDLPRGNFVVPTAIYDFTLCSTLQQEEVIGPLVLVSSFKYQNDAVKLASNSPFGQVVYLFHRDASKALRIAYKIDSGRVFINPSRPIWDSRGHFAGIKASGLGGEGGPEGLDFFRRQTMIGQEL
jgi:acyl-CoA reductase-like NAD-dependent aldehyde dehydrogenase